MLAVFRRTGVALLFTLALGRRLEEDGGDVAETLGLVGDGGRETFVREDGLEVLEVESLL